MIGPEDWITTAGLLAATTAAGIGCAAAIRRLAGRDTQRVEHLATLAVAILCGGIFAYRAAMLHKGWAPVESHVDGLLLLGALLAGALVYLQWSRRMRGIGVFALPILTMLLLWGVCASWWTWRPFQIEGLWRQLHQVSTYLAATCGVLGAAAGGGWLYIHKQMRSKDHAADRFAKLGRLGNLESIEQLMLNLAAGAFVLLSAVAVAGFVLPASTQSDGTFKVKLMFAIAAWALYGVLAAARWMPSIRGKIAAQLSLAGFAMLLIVLAISVGQGGG